MAFILIPTIGQDVMINAWNWRPTLELLRSANLITEDLCERLGTVGSDGRVVDANTADRIADYLDQRLLLMKPGNRIRANLTITDKAKKPLFITPETKIDEVDVLETYSATYEWLVMFRDFCQTSGGFKVS